MDPTDIHPLTGAEEEIAENLAAIGVRMAAARVLVFLSRTDGAFGAEIARGTVQRHSLVNVALHQLMEQGWVDSYRDTPGTRKIKGQRYSLAWPFEEIVSAVEEQHGYGGPAWIRKEGGSRNRYEEMGEGEEF